MSQQHLAEAAGITRQTIGGIETGQYSPSATVAIKLSKALRCSVEDLFWLEEDLPAVEAELAEGAVAAGTVRVSLARVGERWVAHPLAGAAAFREEMIPADGIAGGYSGGPTARVQLLDDQESIARTVVIAGCTPALSLWARSAERWNPGMRVHWIHANSMTALDRLKAGHVHAAGMHLLDSESGEFNTPFVRRAMPERAVSLVNLGVWQEGLVVAPGNPRGVKSVDDLCGTGISIVNRDAGSGARLLLDSFLAERRIPVEQIRGYDRVVTRHEEVALAMRDGIADAGISTESVAATFGLDFAPLRQVRYDLAIPGEFMALESIRRLLETLHHRWVRTQLRLLGGYDVSRSGEVVAEVGPE